MKKDNGSEKTLLKRGNRKSEMNTKSKYVIEKFTKSKYQRPVDTIPVDISDAKTIYLPKLKFEKEPKPEEKVSQDWDSYWLIYRKGFSHLNRGWYQKAQEEFLKIYNWYHTSDAYYFHLIRVFRNLVNRLIKKKKHLDAFSEIQEMFDKCPNATNADIRKYNKLVDLVKNLNPKLIICKREIIEDIEPEFEIKSNFIEYFIDKRKPKGFKIPKCERVSLIKLLELSNFLPHDLPYLFFNSSKIEYISLEEVPSLTHDVYRFRESPYRDAFMVNSKNLVLYVYDWNLNLLDKLNVAKYSSGHTHLRNVDLSSDLSHFLFTNVGKVYLLNSSFKIISSWEVPYKEGWEKRKGASLDSKIPRYLGILELENNPTIEEIKSSFRRLAHKHHPDKNPDDPFAESKMVEIIEAYEYLASEDAQNAFEGLDDEEYWVDTINTIKYEVGGISIEISATLGTGEDWMYGSGISFDASRIYLGCYSGKIYQINKNGVAEKIYVIPEDEKGIYGQTNPVTYIVERGNYLHILTYWYLYILRDDKAEKFIKINDGEVKWFDSGFIHQIKNTIFLYLNNGDLLGSLTFKDSIRHVCYKDDNLLIETNKKAFLFKLKI